MRLENLRPFIIPLLLTQLAFAQTPTIGGIELFGAPAAIIEKVRQSLEIKIGDPIPKSKVELEDQIATAGNIARASVTAICCVQSKAILYIGIQEKEGEGFELREEPAGTAELPPKIVEAFTDFMNSLTGIMKTGVMNDDLSQGHSLAKDPKVRSFQLRFVTLASPNQGVLEDVLKNSASPEQRAIAAYVLGYSSNKKQVIEALRLGMIDPDEGVRGNAVRSLAAIAFFAQKNPRAGIAVDANWFVAMLRSPSLADREKAATTLVNLSDQWQAHILEPVRKNAVAAITEMARWPSLEHALPAYILLGRIAGIDEKRLKGLWTAGQRETVITEAAGILAGK